MGGCFFGVGSWVGGWDRTGYCESKLPVHHDDAAPTLTSTRGPHPHPNLASTQNLILTQPLHFIYLPVRHGDVAHPLVGQRARPHDANRGAHNTALGHALEGSTDA